MGSEVETELRRLRGQTVRLVLRDEGVIEGRIRGLLESDDGLVAYVVDGRNFVHTVHYHLIAEVQEPSLA